MLAPYPLFARPSSVDQVSYSQLFEKNLVESCPFRRLVSFRLVSRRSLSVEGRVLSTLRPTLARPAPLPQHPPPPSWIPECCLPCFEFPCRAPDPREGLCPAKTAGRPVAPPFASLVAFARSGRTAHPGQPGQ